MDSHDRQPAEQARVRRPSDGAEADRAAPSLDAAGPIAVGRLLHGGGPVGPAVVADLAAVAGNAAVAGLVRGPRVARAALAAQGAGPLGPRTAEAIDAERGGGSPLPDPVRTDMEQHLGADLSAVRVHTGPVADTLNRAVTAKAFTTGTDVFFSAGQFNPASRTGRELLAHELAHVVQQSDDPGGAAGVSHEDDPAEVEARAVAREVAHGTAAPPDDPDEPAAAPVREVAVSSAVGRTVVARDPWYNEGSAGTARPAAGPIGDIEVGLYRISSDPQTARKQLQDIALKHGVQEAQRVRNELQLRRAQLLSARHETWLAQDPAYMAVIAAMDAELTSWNQFEETFKTAAENKTKKMLAFSKQRIEAEVSRYGLTDKRGSGGGFGMADNADAKAMASAARQLAYEVANLEGAVTGFEMRRRDTSRRGFGVAAERFRVQVHQAEERYLVMRHEKEARFPILASFSAYKSRTPGELRAVRRKLEAVGRGVDDENAAGMVAGDAFTKLKKIETVEQAIADKKLNYWSADNVIALTKIELGIAPGSLYDRVIDQQVRDVASEKALRNMLFSAFAVALGLLAAPLAAAGMVVAGVAATAGSVAVSAGMTLEHLEEYQLQEAANATDFDKARVISSAEPSLFWLAVDIVLTLAGVGGAALAAKTAAQTSARAFRNLAPRARAAVNAGDDTAKKALDALEDAAAREVPDAPELGKTVREAAEQERARTGPPGGATGARPPVPPAQPAAPAGPVYRHGLNKGGLEDILANQRLRSTPASMVRGGSDAVRAYPGPLEVGPGGWKGGSTVVEFTTDLPATPQRFMGEKGVSWFMPEGDYLPIRVQKVYHADGRITIYEANGAVTEIPAGSAAAKGGGAQALPQPKTFDEMSKELADEVGAAPPGSVPAGRPDYDEVRQRLDALVPSQDKGPARAGAEVHVEGYAGPRSLKEVSKEPKPNTPKPVPRSELTGPDVHTLRPNLVDEQGKEILDEASGLPKANPQPVPRSQTEKSQYTYAERLPPDRPGRQGAHWGTRAHDAEAKLLERVSAQLPENAVGTVHLKTSHPPCPACIQVIHRFRGKHKGVQVVLY